ncbi:MAG TPA: response regulator [Candidatus Obscuribacterales bacterium]
MSSTISSAKTVLAVDDSTVMQEMIKRALTSEYRVLVADNAVDALALIYHQPVSVLLLDVSMPGVDGLELCRTLRSLPQFIDLPIIMLTARDGAFDKVQGRLAGATEYLTKPFDAEQLRQVVRNFLNSNCSS